MDINMETEMQRENPTAAGSSPSGGPLALTRLQVYTVANLQQGLGTNITQVIGGTTADADAKVIRNIVRTIKINERLRLFCQLILLLPFFPITFCCMRPLYHAYAKRIAGAQQVAKGGIRHMVRLEGEQWSRYVEHIFANSRRQIRKVSKKRLLARGYGHLLFGPRGFVLDVLLGMSYKNIMAVRTEVIRAPNGVDMMLRAWFCKRIVLVILHRNTDMSNDPFKFDIFLPPHMSTEQVSALSNFIMLESTCRPPFI